MTFVSDHPTSTPSRRPRSAPRDPDPGFLIGSHRVAPDALHRFNAVLTGLGRLPMSAGELAHAARQRATADGHPSRQPDWIARRLRRGLTISAMLVDPAWQPAAATGAIADAVDAYLRSRDDLIPDDLPRIGRLDDALVVEAAWPLLADEVRAYRKATETRPRPPAAALRMATPRLHSYLPPAAAYLFRVC